MKNDVLWGFILGVMVMVWLSASPWSDASLYRNAIKECEKSLPRDEHCVIIGLPKSKD
jgi:hypothetical protein